MTNNKPTLLTSQEVADLLNIKENTLAIWRCKGTSTLPFIKIGRCVRYREEDVQAFIGSQMFIHTDKKFADATSEATQSQE